MQFFRYITFLSAFLVAFATLYLAVYVGIGVMFVGGLRQLMHAAMDEDVDAMIGAGGLVKMMFSWLVAWLIVLCGGSVAAVIYNTTEQ